MALTDEEAETDEAIWGEIQGQTITFPMVVASANIATLLFTVPAPAAAALVPGGDFEIVESVPGSTQLIIAACDYIENPWGDYREINIGFLAKPVGGGPETAGSFIYRMPVDQAFTCEAGTKVMGFPKTVEQITTEYHDDVVVFDLVFGGRPTLHLTVPHRPRRRTTDPCRRGELLLPRRRSLRDHVGDGHGLGHRRRPRHGGCRAGGGPRGRRVGLTGTAGRTRSGVVG